MRHTLYDIKNLIKSRSQKHGYRLLIRSLKISQGDRIAITGPSGCGKSTTLDLLGLSLKPDSSENFDFSPGEQILDIQRLWDDHCEDSLAELRLKHLGYVLQSGELLSFLTIAENMTLTARLSGQDGRTAGEAAREFAEALGISHLWERMPATLSVGERQRVAIVRALCSHPQVILADEPTAALDPVHARKVMEAFLNTLDRFGGTLVLVTHNLQWSREGGLTNISFEMAETDDTVTAIIDYNGGDE